jgi:group I intron endonuclease
MYIFVLMKIKDSIPKSPGIYMLRSKTDPELFYIGSTKNLLQRYFAHKQLRIDHNPHIFGHIKKYGKNDLEFIILELCDYIYLIEREQYYISEFKPSYNLHRFASQPDSSSILAKKIAFTEMGHSCFDKESQILNLICNTEILIPLNI